MDDFSCANDTTAAMMVKREVVLIRKYKQAVVLIMIRCFIKGVVMFDWEEKFLQNPKFSRNIGEKAELLAYTK